MHAGEYFFRCIVVVGGSNEACEHPLLTVGLVVGVLRLIQTVIIKEEGKVFDQRDMLFGVFVVLHDAHRDVGIGVDQLGTCRGTDDHRGGVACITVSEHGAVEVEHADEECGEHLAMIDRTQGIVHRTDDCRR